MITAWMLYSLLLGAMLGVGAMLADRAAAAARLPRRFAWMGALAMLIVLTALAPWRRAERVALADVALPVATVASHTAPVLQPVSLRERIVDVVTYPVRHGIDDLSALVPSSLDRTVGALWLLASAASLLTLLGVLRKLDRQRRAWPQATMHGQRVRVAVQHGPAVYGVFHPEIVLPSALLTRTAHDQQLVLSHEAEHKRARDPLVLSAAAVAAALIPWHPIAWWMASRLRLAVELDCDARVLRRGASPRKYGELLLALSQSLPSRQHSLHALALLDSPRHLERRLLAMTSRTSRRAPLAISAFLLAGAAVVVAACNTDVPTAAQIRDADVSAVTQTLGLPSGKDVRYVVNGAPVTEAEAKSLKAGDIASIAVTGGDTIALRGKSFSASGDAEVRIVTRGFKVNPNTLPLRQNVVWAGDTAFRADSIKLYHNNDTLIFRNDSMSFVPNDSMSFLRRRMNYQSDSTSFTGSQVLLRADSMNRSSVLTRSSFSGARDSAPRVILKGGASPAGGEPLLIIDGVIVADGMGGLQSLNPNDIASIEVVKGNAAAAIYGSRASNGVISVTTKRVRQRM